MTDHQILELIYGANSKPLELLSEVSNEPTKKQQEIPSEVVVSKDQFVKILSRDLTDDKKKTQK